MEITDLVWIDSAGYHYADFPSFLTYLTDKYTSIYGSDVYLGSASQDGQWLGVVSQALYDTAALGASTYNSFSPTSAQGVGLSRVVKINGLRRQNPSHSTVEAVIVGTAFTSLVNASAIDDLNQIWNLPASVTIPISGTITVTATAEAEGAIQAQPGTITGIYTPTLGWQSVNNPAAATVGSPVELDGALRNRQAVSTSIPAQTVLDATIGALSNVDGVTALTAYENPTSTVDSDGLPAHSISLVVQGGTDDDIAQTILDYKTPGTQTNGTTSLPLVDPKGVPITINFYRPKVASIAVRVTLVPLSSWVTSNEDLIATAVAAYIDSIPIGGTVVLTQVLVAAYAAGTTAAGSFTISSVELAVQSSGYINLTSNPSPADTVTVNGVVVTFVASAPTGSQVLIGANKEETAENLQVFLSASASAFIDLATYAINDTTAGKVDVTFIVPGPGGNSFTLAKSGAGIAISGAVLAGGAYGSTNVDLAFDAIATCDTDNVSFIT